MELVEHRRGVQRLGNEHRDSQTSEDDSTCVNRNGTGRKDRDDDTLSDCESETSEVLSVGSEPTPAADGLKIDHEDDPRSGENYESDTGTAIATRGIVSSGEQEQTSANGRSTKERSTASLSRSPSPSPSSSASCDPPQSPASYCATPPQNRRSPSSPAASSVRSPASSSATASSPGRPDAHQEAIVPRYQSASISASIHHLGLSSVGSNHRDSSHQHHHLLSSNRYAAAALVTTCRDNDLGEYTPVVGVSTIPRIPVHHPIGLTTVSHGTSAVADLIGYSQQSLEPTRSLLHARAAPTLNVPLVTRLSLSPPTAMTVTGLQANPPSTAFHPVAVAAAAAAAAAAGCREANPLLAGHAAHFPPSGHGITGVQHSLLQQQASPGASQIQHVPPSPTMLQHHHHHHHHHQQNHQGSHNSRHNSIGNESPGQHRLSISKLLQRNSQDPANSRDTGSPESPEPRVPDERHRQTHRHTDAPRSNSSPGQNCLTNSPAVSTTANNHHRNNNNNSSSSNNNMQHQASLKFSIDNILKADFGRRITDPISLKKSRTKKVVPRPIDLTKDFRETSSEGSERGSETSATNLSPGATSAVNPTSNSSTGASNNVTSGVTTTGNTTTNAGSNDSSKQMLWPAWVYCTRYSDRPSSGRSPRTRRVKRPSDSRATGTSPEEKRPRTAFSGEQLARLKREFGENRYLTERRRQQLSRDLGLNEAQIKIWFQNKRAKIKKASGQKNPLALQLMAQGLYNHSTVPLTKEEEEQAAELQAK